MVFRNYYRMIFRFSLVEFHDIDFFFRKLYNKNIGVPRLEDGMIITFLGHSLIQDCSNLLEKIEKAIVDTMGNSDAAVFYCGGYGAFDHYCARACRTVKKTHPKGFVFLRTVF